MTGQHRAPNGHRLIVGRCTQVAVYLVAAKLGLSALWLSSGYAWLIEWTSLGSLIALAVLSVAYYFFSRWVDRKPRSLISAGFLGCVFLVASHIVAAEFRSIDTAKRIAEAGKIYDAHKARMQKEASTREAREPRQRGPDAGR